VAAEDVKLVELAQLPVAVEPARVMVQKILKTLPQQHLLVRVAAVLLLNLLHRLRVMAERYFSDAMEIIQPQQQPVLLHELLLDYILIMFGQGMGASQYNGSFC
jgi:hypothetical protein